MNNETIIQNSSKFSLLSEERLLNNIRSIDHILLKNIQGHIVEIGVYRGGSIMAMIYTLQRNNALKHIYLYDTFEGMTDATQNDTIIATGEHYNNAVVNSVSLACIASLEDVKQNISTTNYDETYIHYVKGNILNNQIFPDKISILRLDTDFYDSTKHELETFYDLVSPGGIIIIDDYGFWNGSRRATDEFLQDKPHIKLYDIDNTGVFFVKP